MSLVTDASNTHVGAALQQKESGGWCPLAFFSAKPSVTQQRYSALNRELLGVFLALRHFCFELEGQNFHILTYRLPLVSALLCVSLSWSACQQHQLSYISELTSDLRHTPGAANAVADNLSFPAPASPPAPKSSSAPQLPPSPGVKVSEVLAMMEVSEVSDSTIPSPFPTAVLHRCTPPKGFPQPPQNGSLLCDTKTNVLRPLVSSSQRFNILTCHNQEFVHPDVLSLQGLSGGAKPMTSVTGANPAFSANKERSSAMFTFALKRFQS